MFIPYALWSSALVNDECMVFFFVSFKFLNLYWFSQIIDEIFTLTIIQV